ncbi:MAG TPA: SiaC family regulatory phosphoprotein [Bacteroidales bacterium]|nr:SiaC family regulatory phosphoprotein [Bacteroidales bacterium]
MTTKYWKATYNTPEIDLKPGFLSIRGRTLMDDPYSFYQPIIKKIGYMEEDTFHIEMIIQSANKESMVQLYRLLLTAKKNKNIHKVNFMMVNDNEKVPVTPLELTTA